MPHNNAIGIDIGTTTICAIIMDGENGKIFDTITIANNSSQPARYPWQKTQNASVVLDNVNKILNELTDKYKPVSCIGLTGHMHGIVYTDDAGDAVSPVYTWQDGRGDQEYKDNISYASYLSKISGYRLATGFGAVTHFYNLTNGIAPLSAKYICTISDYIAMKLCNAVKPVLHPSNAASLGFFDLDKNDFDRRSLLASNIDDSVFPEVSKAVKTAGATKSGIPVAIAIGDNHASFIGSVHRNEECILVNIGTGSQISMYADNAEKRPQIDIRPFIGNGYLHVGAPLCGGRAYAILEQFFRSTVALAIGTDSPKLYNIMNEIAGAHKSISDKLDISVRFCGTRDNPSLRGSINNISEANFTPQHFVIGILEGIVNELHSLYQAMLPKTLPEPKPKTLVGSGNGIRLNNPLREMVSKIFGMPVRIPLYEEEAAYGSALYALTATGFFKNIQEAQKLIRYI